MPSIPASAEAAAPAVLAAMSGEFGRHSLSTDQWLVELDAPGARVIG